MATNNSISLNNCDLGGLLFSLRIRYIFVIVMSAIILLSSSASMLLYGLSNLDFPELFIYILQLLFSMGNIIFVIKTKNVNRASAICPIIFIIILNHFFIHGHYNYGMLPLVIIYPVVVFFLFDTKPGLFWIGLYSLNIIILYTLHVAHIINGNFSMAFLNELFLSYIFITVLSYFYQYKKERYHSLLMEQLYTDHLTCLFNRNKLLTDISVAKNPRIIIINIDRFKEINNLYGNRIGDSLITELGFKIQEYSTPPWSAYRIHADEFCLFCDGVCDTEDIRKLVVEIHDSLENTPLNIEGNEIPLSVTLAYSEEKQNIFESGDMALKWAKRQKENFLSYNNAIPIIKEFENNLKWVKIINDAIQNQRVTVFFQPIIDLSTGEIYKHEALIRIIDDSGNIISPNNFLDIAKRSKLYPVLSKIVAEKVFSTVRKIKSISARISINLSIDDINNQAFLQFIRSEMQDRSLAQNITFEILESEGITNYNTIISFIGEMKSYGCSFAIDDFGSGYSNFNHVLKLNVDYIKIDGSLIRDIDKDTNSQVIVGNIVSFCKKLGFKTTAEYVHSEEIYHIVKEIGVDYAQGYYKGAPGENIVL